MRLSYNGVYFTSLTDHVAEVMAARFDPNEVLSWMPIESHNLWHLPIPNQFRPPAIVPNVLNWPNDASRFATFYAIIDDADLVRLRQVGFTRYGPAALTLLTLDETENVSVPMYMLAPRPLVDPQFMGENGLWLLPLVDKRYFFWSAAASITGATSWTLLIGQIAAAWGVTITVSTIAADYSTPTIRFDAYQQPLPLLLDAICYTVGLRFVAKIDGTFLAQSYSDAKTVQDAQVALVPTRSAFSGGAFRTGEVKRSLPDTVAVAFQKTVNGVAVAGSYVEEITLVSLALPEYSQFGSITAASNASPIVITTSAAHNLTSGDLVDITSVGGNTAANGTWAATVISGTTFSLYGSTGNANYTSGGLWSAVVNGFIGQKVAFGDVVAVFTTNLVVPDNEATLLAWATQWATDWYLWELSDSDYQFASVVDWTMNGNIDQIEWHLMKGRATTRISRGSYNDLLWGAISDATTSQGYTTVNVVTNVCPIYNSSGAMTGITVEHTPVLVPSPVGERYCVVNPDDCCAISDTCCPGVTIPETLCLDDGVGNTGYLVWAGTNWQGMIGGKTYILQCLPDPGTLSDIVTPCCNPVKSVLWLRMSAFTGNYACLNGMWELEHTADSGDACTALFVPVFPTWRLSDFYSDIVSGLHNFQCLSSTCEQGFYWQCLGLTAADWKLTFAAHWCNTPSSSACSPYLYSGSLPITPVSGTYPCFAIPDSGAQTGDWTIYPGDSFGNSYVLMVDNDDPIEVETLTCSPSFVATFGGVTISQDLAGCGGETIDACGGSHGTNCLGSTPSALNMSGSDGTSTILNYLVSGPYGTGWQGVMTCPIGGTQVSFLMYCNRLGTEVCNWSLIASLVSGPDNCGHVQMYTLNSAVSSPSLQIQFTGGTNAVVFTLVP